MPKSFHKLATFVLIMIIMSTPLVSAFGQSFSCDMQADSSAMIETTKNSMPANHDCCEKPEKNLCSHCDECECDHAQANLTAIKIEAVDLIFTVSTQFETIFHTVQTTKTLSSLYRPPRSFL